MTKAITLVLFVTCALGGWYLRALRDTTSTAHAIVEQSGVSSEGSRTLSRGTVLYQVHCAKCHGAEGHGDTEAAARLKPPPRDFAARPWRFEMSVEGVKRVARDGIRGTAMPASPFLSEEDLIAISDHVMELTRKPGTSTIAASTEGEVCSVSNWAATTQPLAIRTFIDRNDNVVSLDDLRGAPVIVHLWGTTCAACLREMPNLEKLAARHKNEKLRVLHVCADAETAAEAQEIMERVIPGTTAYVDASGLLSVTVLPTAYLIAADGTPRFQVTGTANWESEEASAQLSKWLAR